jgi:choice-of-anchor A domain-containing protein
MDQQLAVHVQEKSMRKKSGSLSLWGLLAILGLAAMLGPSGFAVGNIIKTVSVQSPDQQCAGSYLNQFANPSVNSLCWSGNGSSTYVPFSLAALEAGGETYINPQNQFPTMEAYNDTGTTTLSFQLSGTIGANAPITCQGINGSTGCTISGPAGTFGNAKDGAGGATYPAQDQNNPWPAVVTMTFYGVPLNSYVGLQWSSWSGIGQSAITVSAPTGQNCNCAFGIAGAFNLVALTGDISDAADITGRIAASGQVTQATTIGNDLRTGDPYISLASANGGPYALVAGGGIPTSNYFSVNAGGNVYSATQTNAGFNFANENYAGSLYEGSTLVIGGPSPIDFTVLASEMNSLSGQLNALTANGVVCTVDNTGSIVLEGGCPSSPTFFNPYSQHYNPSWIVLYGTSTTANVFNLTQAQFQNNDNLDIEVPTGSTVIINVAGTSDTLQTSLYYQGNTVTDANAGLILFNFAAATSVTINGQFDGTLLAPLAYLSGNSQMGGMFIAASIGPTGEVHYVPFGGTLPLYGSCLNHAASLTVSCAAVNTGVVGVAFNSGPMTVTGGTAPYTYSIVGTLPDGLALNTSTGAITGTPTASGTVSVQVKDANGATGAACGITINAPLSVACAAVTTGTVGVLFNSGPMTVNGGLAPYSYSIVGTLPAGLTLNTSTGAITGTPTASGTFSVKVTDANGATGTACAIIINAPLSVTCATATTGVVGVAFNSGPMTVTAGAAPYTYSIVGTLPAGLALDTSTGAITGTPTASGTFSVKVTDANGATGTACAIGINAPLSVTCAAATTGQVGIAFNSGSIAVTGGTAPYTYSIVGTLPAGLTLNTSTGAITGTPTASGSFSVKVTDANSATGTACAITVTSIVQIGSGDAATIGYWHNNNGQALIDEMNGGATATNLANWLATNFPYLYGTKSSNNLTGKTNVEVAALFLTFFGESGQKTDAQVMAGALAVYVTEPSLADSNIAGSQGFNVSTTGTAAKSINVGTDGTAAGLVNNTSYTVMELLQQANLEVRLGTFNATAFNNIFSNINQTGDIVSGSSSAPLSLACAAVKAGQVGAAFNSGSMTASGGTSPYTYSIVGTLPAGLTLNTSTGAVTGTPTATGIFSIEVTDSQGSGSTTSCPISIGTGYTLTVNPASVTVVAGQSANATFTFTPFGGYVGTINFSCSGLPAGATCTFVPPSVTATGSNTVQTSIFTVTTSASGTTTLAQSGTTPDRTLASFFLLPSLLLGGFITWRRRSFSIRMRGMLLLLLVGVMLAGGAVGCSNAAFSNNSHNGNSSTNTTPLGSNVVTVVASANVSTSSGGSSSTQMATFTLTVVQ